MKEECMSFLVFTLTRVLLTFGVQDPRMIILLQNRGQPPTRYNYFIQHINSTYIGKIEWSLGLCKFHLTVSHSEKNYFLGKEMAPDHPYWEPVSFCWPPRPGAKNSRETEDKAPPLGGKSQTYDTGSPGAPGQSLRPASAFWVISFQKASLLFILVLMVFHRMTALISPPSGHWVSKEKLGLIVLFCFFPDLAYSSH